MTAGPVVAAPQVRTVATLDDLDPASTGSSGVRVVRVDRPVRFGTDRRTDLAHLLALREATSHTVLLDWTLEGTPSVALRDCVHLVPPRDGTDRESQEVAGRWREAYRYGSFHHRAGPGFVIVKDVRPGGERSRMTIDGDGAHLFLELAATGRYPSAGPARDAVAVLEEAGLALRAGDLVVVLPPRLRHWPVPFLAI